MQRSLSQSMDTFTPMAIPRRRSNSTSNCIIEKKRGFKPSDRFDPIKKEFLVRLSKKFWQKTVRESCRTFCIGQTNNFLGKVPNIHYPSIGAKIQHVRTSVIFSNMRIRPLVYFHYYLNYTIGMRSIFVGDRSHHQIHTFRLWLNAVLDLFSQRVYV